MISSEIIKENNLIKDFRAAAYFITFSSYNLMFTKHGYPLNVSKIKSIIENV